MTLYITGAASLVEPGLDVLFDDIGVITASACRLRSSESRHPASQAIHRGHTLTACQSTLHNAAPTPCPPAANSQ